ncbi:OmpA family protein [Sandarakinorhabdus sp.]|uniref:OmpA family protein n=1 Tax=Sandarakinorhabdus sp. TaxID=1916663 RepID=UPI00334136BB
MMRMLVLSLLLAAPAAAVDCNPEAVAAAASDARAPIDAYRQGMADLQADRYADADLAFRRAYGGAGKAAAQLEVASLARLMETALAMKDLRVAWHRLRLLRQITGTSPRDAWVDALILQADAATAAVSESADVLAFTKNCRSFGVAPAINLRILFETGSATLDAEGTAQIARLAQAFQAANVKGALVRGHTDQTGSDAYNDVLSRARAETVARALARAVPALQGKLRTDGRGERELLYAAAGADQDRLNRRVELVLDP